MGSSPQVEAFLEEVANWAHERKGVRAAVLLGSQARAALPADEFSDVDLLLVVDDPAPFLEFSDWLEPFGEPLLTFVEGTAVGAERERRVLFRSGLEVDFSVVTPTGFGTLARLPEAAGVVARGYRVLYDEVGLSDELADAAKGTVAPEEVDLGRLSQDFWYHALWAAKKLRRGEIYVAKQACDCYLKALLITVLAAREHGRDTWHRGRFLERWAAPEDLAEFRGAFALYDEADVARAIRATADLFERVQLELGCSADHAEVRRRLDELLEPYPPFH
jgi:aminoglycoside 6-adenylyltransferase